MVRIKHDLLVAVPISFYELSSFQIPINPRNNCSVSYVNFTNFPDSRTPILVGPVNLETTINETNHGKSHIVMNITGCIYFVGVDDQMFIVLTISFYGDLSSSLHPTGLELRANGTRRMSAFDHKCPFNDNISNVSFVST